MNNQPKPQNDRKYYMFALRIMGDFGATIAVPAVLGALIGTWLDEKYQKYPLFTVVCLIVAFLATIKIIRKKAQRYGDEYNKL